jgi:hypothetical protein
MRLLAALALAVLIAPATAGAQVPSGNLLANGNAEAVTGSQDGVEVVPPPAWTTDGPFSEVAYGAPEFLTTDDSASWSGGASFFAGGPDNAASSATQVVNVAGAGTEIDRGGVSATLSALIGGYLGQTDYATVTATFLNASSGTLGTLDIGPVTPEDRQSATTLLSRSASAAVPAGTRSISVRIDATRFEGAFNDGYVDNVSLALGTGGGGTPVFHKTVVASPVSGKVLVKRPGSSKFVELDEASGIPLGSTVDVKKGKVQLTSVPKKGGTPETAAFYDGIFKVTQPGAITELRLVEALACGGGGAAQAAAKKPKTRKLWGDGSGSFRTRGQYSAATVRGTKWFVQDTCTSTLTRVAKGVVAVNDFVKHKTVLVKAGKSYTARRKGR